MLRGDTRKRYFGRKDKRKEVKWKTMMQNTRLDDEEREWLHISEFEREGTAQLSNCTEKLVPETCHWQRI